MDPAEVEDNVKDLAAATRALAEVVAKEPVVVPEHTPLVAVNATEHSDTVTCRPLVASVVRTVPAASRSCRVGAVPAIVPVLERLTKRFTTSPGARAKMEVWKPPVRPV